MREIKLIIIFIVLNISSFEAHAQDRVSKPNILFIISDDQGYPHASAYGSKLVRTPAFDEIAKNGILFTNYFVSAPQCSPSRASILTGRHIWQNGPAGTHWSTFTSGLTPYTDILKKNGYDVGYTGKGWAPGNWVDGGRTTDPVGVKYISKKEESKYINSRPASGISKENYVASFNLFLQERNENQPFCFWVGGWEPHRPYEEGSGLKNDRIIDEVEVPDYLPDSEIVKSDLLDYALEIEWFDKQVGKILRALEEKELLDNTIVVFTSDNGMPFPRAKAYSFDDGNHVPMAIMWNERIINPGRVVEDLVSAVDVFPTFLEAAGVKNNIPETEGKSLIGIFENGRSGLTDKAREFIYWGRERHGSARWNNLGYPQRAIRSDNFLYIWNLKPERYPVGAPKKIKGDSLVWAYGDIDPSPTKTYMIKNQSEYSQIAFEKHPEEMLYDIKNDPYCMVNLAEEPGFEDVKKEMSGILKQKLKETKDPRVGEFPSIWESYRRYGPIHKFPVPGWAKEILENHVIKD